MASTDTSTASSQISAVAADNHKRTVDEAFLNKMKGLVERLRLENATLKKSLDVERGEVRALKARHDSTLRNLKTEYKKKEEFLEKQLRTVNKPDRLSEEAQSGNRLVDIKKITIEIQSLKSANKGLQEKLKVAQAAESARAAELRAQAARHAAIERAARRDARAHCLQLLEEIKSKERVIIQLKREAARTAPALQNDQAQRMECGANELSRKLRVDQGKEKSNREDLKTDIQHRKETFYREAPSDEDSAVSSAPASLSPQPLNDMWSCGGCRASSDRAAASARECSRLADALRDARDQIELMEFRLLELEDAHPDKGPRDNLTDSDSGCVSPGSRIKDSASPELKRMDSGYKSPHAPSSPCNPRRLLGTPHDDFKEDFAKAQVLADILDRNSETTSDSLKSNPVKEHLEQMILNAASAEDRSCLEQVLMLLYNLQTLSSSVSEDECFQAKPRRICDLRSKLETDIPSHKTHKAVATVTPYQQKGYKSESLESLYSEERKPNILQESGIFEGVETETKETQTEVNESFECSGELNTEIQRLNSIREKLERQGVRNRTLSSKEESDGLECRCVKLGKKHKQYYERRLKFLEGKISIYEAAQDVKEAKLAQRLQKEFLLENRIQELELQLSELQDKYERLEEECCELEEIENDTRLHWQQLEMDYELCSAQLRDMTEQRECSRGQAERLMTELQNRELALKTRESELLERLDKLEKAVPALIAWNVVQAVGSKISFDEELRLLSRIGTYEGDPKEVIDQIKEELMQRPVSSTPLPKIDTPTESTTKELQRRIAKLTTEKKQIEERTSEVKKSLENRIQELKEELEIAKAQLSATLCGGNCKKEKIEAKIEDLERKAINEKKAEKLSADPMMCQRIRELQFSEQDLKNRITELERRETAYLEMLTQADDMWAEMEGGYKKKIEESQKSEMMMKCKVVGKQIEDNEQCSKQCDLFNNEPVKRNLSLQEKNISVWVCTECENTIAEAEKSKADLKKRMLKEEQEKLKNVCEQFKNKSKRDVNLEEKECFIECAKAADETEKSETALKILDCNSQKGKLEEDKEQLIKVIKQLKQQLREEEESKSITQTALEASKRDIINLKEQNATLECFIECVKAAVETEKSETDLKIRDGISQVVKLEENKEQLKNEIEQLKQKLRETEESKSITETALEESKRDIMNLKEENTTLECYVECIKAAVESEKSETAFKSSESISQIGKVEEDKEQLKNVIKELKQQLIEVEDSKSIAMIALEESKREIMHLEEGLECFIECVKAAAETEKCEAALEIRESQNQIGKLEEAKEQLKIVIEQLKQKLREEEEAKLITNKALEKSKKDIINLEEDNNMLASLQAKTASEAKKFQTAYNLLCNKYQIEKLEENKKEFKKVVEPLKNKLKEVEESESMFKIALEKAERDVMNLKTENISLAMLREKAAAEAEKSEAAFKILDCKFQKEMEHLRKINKKLDSEMKTHRDISKKTELCYVEDLETIRKELTRSCKSNQDLEVTNSELKEEVESLEKQLALTQKALSQCKRKCDEKVKTLSHELSIKTEELEELRSETMRQSYHASRVELQPERTEYVDEGYSIYTAVPKKTDYGRMHHSMSYITSDSRCSCPSMRSHLVGQLIEDLFDRIHNTADDDLTRLCNEIAAVNSRDVTFETKAKITNYLLMAISKELVRSIGDADAKTDTEEWQRAVSSMTHTMPGYCREAGDDASLRLAGNAGVVRGAARLASVSCACAAARLCAARPDLAAAVKSCQEEVLDHGDVKIMEEQLANAIESIVNCPSCALGTNAIVWSTDV